MKNNKVFLLSFVLLFFYQVGQAQLQTGLKLGTNFSTFIEKNHHQDIALPDLSTTTSLLAGLTVRYGFSKHFFLSGDLMYIGKGTNGVFLIKEYTGYNLHYLEASLSPTLNIHQHFNIEAGFYYSQLLRANVKWFSGYSRKVTDEFEREDYGLQIGISGEYKGFLLGLRYQQGLADWNSPVGVTWKNQGLQLFLSYYFFLNNIL